MPSGRKVPPGAGTGSSRPPSAPDAEGHGLFGAQSSTGQRPVAPSEVLEGALRGARETGLRMRVEGTPSPSSPLVLVVDDMDDQRELYELALRGAGFRVMRARDGHEAVKVARDWLPDLIVMDYSMPEMDGAQAMGLLAAEPSTARIPVVMISAFARDVPRGARLGCAAFLAKPCAGEDLVHAVRRVIDARSPGA